MAGAQYRKTSVDGTIQQLAMAARSLGLMGHRLGSAPGTQRKGLGKNNLDKIQSWVPGAERSEAPDSLLLWRPLGSATGTRIVQLVFAQALTSNPQSPIALTI